MGKVTLSNLHSAISKEEHQLTLNLRTSCSNFLSMAHQAGQTSNHQAQLTICSSRSSFPATMGKVKVKEDRQPFPQSSSITPTSPFLNSRVAKDSSHKFHSSITSRHSSQLVRRCFRKVRCRRGNS